HFQFDMLVSMSTYGNMPDLNNWSWAIMHTYIKLNEEGNMDKVEEGLATIVKKHAIPYIQSDPHAFTTGEEVLRFNLQPLTDIHLHSDMLREMQTNGNVLYIYLFIGISFFIILIASVNFMNLSTAQAGKRAKEVGVRKMFGAHRSGLILQFLTEAMLFSFLAGAIALMLVEMLQGSFQIFTGSEISVSVWEQPSLLLGIFFVLIAIGLLAGSYPAFYLTSFKPIQSLKQVLTKGQRASMMRNGLVVFQFAISMGMIIATLGVIQQIRYIQQKELGFDKEQVLVIQNDREIGESDERAGFRERLIQESGIQEVAFSTGIPGLKNFHMRDLRKESALEGVGIHWYQADEYFRESLELEMNQGRWFSKSFTTDSNAVILNQAAVKALGLEDPVGSFITLNKGANDEARLQVIGIVQDFHFESFSHTIKPLAIQHLHDDIFKDYITIRLKNGSLEEQVKTVESVWKEFEPGVPFNYSFLDERFDRLFQSEQNLGRIFSLFTGLAIFIACLGFLGLASYTTEKRAREIGIRKVLGASVTNILYMLSREYMKLVLIALAIAIPVT
ncbi:MAG: FtsX-like permease family protein, partial [Bacteroidetes bacterium]|nr:FtsX-like permease family protein [Bacteroidota bacterium]